MKGVGMERHRRTGRTHPGGARSRAGGGQTPRPVEPVGGQTPRPVTEYQRHGLRSLGGGVRALEGFRQVS